MKPTEISRFEDVPNEPDRYVYRIKNLGAGSARYGPCEVCGRPASETSIQVEGRTYLTDAFDDEGPGKIAITYHECETLWGHEECLRGARR